MTNIGKLFGIIIAFAIAPHASAQCAPGIPSAGNPGCGPPNQPNSPYYRESGPTQPPAQAAVWADRWVAVAIDSQTGDAGFSTDRRSKAEASQAALDDCGTAGSTGCKVLIAYYNQCAALAQPLGGGTVSAVSSADSEDAKKSAIRNCGGREHSCKIVYSNCVVAARQK